MKRILSLLLALSVAVAMFAACGSASQVETEPASTSGETTSATAPTQATKPTVPAPTYKPQVQRETVTIGNLKFTLEPDQRVEDLGEGSYFFTLVEGKATLFVYAGDVSEFSVSLAEAFTKLQHKTLTEDRIIVDSVETDLQIAGFDVTAESYGTLDENGDLIACLDISFTDTWYSYTLLFICDGEGEKVSDYAYIFGQMLGDVVYVGEAPREDTEDDATAPATTTTSITTGERNALRRAEDYLDLMAFSYTGLIEQLEYEGYTTEEATYAADNCGADWYEQANIKAADYLELMAFSRDGLIDQLEYEGFTHDQAVYGAEQNGY